MRVMSYGYDAKWTLSAQLSKLPQRPGNRKAHRPNQDT